MELLVEVSEGGGAFEVSIVVGASRSGAWSREAIDEMSGLGEGRSVVKSEESRYFREVQ